MKNNKLVAFQYIHFLLPYWYQGIVVLLCTLFTTVSSLVPPYITKIIIDDVLPVEQFSYLIIAVSILLGIVLANLVMSFVSDYLYSWVSNRIIRDIRVELFNHLMDLPLSFHNKQDTGDIIFRLNNDIGVIQSVLTSSALRLLHSSLTLAGLVAVLCWLDVQLFLLCAVVIPFFLLNLIYFQPKIKRVVERMQSTGSEIFSYTIERFNNIQLIQQSNGFLYEAGQFRSALDRLIDIIMRSVFYSASMETVAAGLVGMAPVFILGWGGYQVMQGAITVGTLIAFLQYMLRFFRPVESLHDLYMDLVRGAVSMSRVLEFLHIPTQTAGHSGTEPFSYKHKIVFRDVHISFDEKPVLQELNLTLVKGKKYALIGASGVGKTTVANLLCGFDRPNRGCIEVDGVPLQDIRLMELRRHIGVVSQHTLLFHDTIWENIRYGNFEREPAEIERFARQMGLDEALDLQAQVGEQGMQLSGGQRQRVAIARTALKEVELLILDEATAALDSESEQAVCANLRQRYADKTLLMISHRFSTVQEADEVICLAEGKVVEQGRPGDLLRQRGYYWRFFQNQLEAATSGTAV